MRYWVYFVAKLAVAGVVMAAVWKCLVSILPEQRQVLYVYPPQYFPELSSELAILIYGLVCVGVFYGIIWDQRYRCRTCLRRLRMPVETGSWGAMLRFGRPRIEYICTYGHGTLKVPEVQITGDEPPDWTPNEDMWKELMKR